MKLRLAQLGSTAWLMAITAATAQSRPLSVIQANVVDMQVGTSEKLETQPHSQTRLEARVNVATIDETLLQLVGNTHASGNLPNHEATDNLGGAALEASQSSTHAASAAQEDFLSHSVTDGLTAADAKRAYHRLRERWRAEASKYPAVPGAVFSAHAASQAAYRRYVSFPQTRATRNAYEAERRRKAGAKKPSQTKQKKLIGDESDPDWLNPVERAALDADQRRKYDHRMEQRRWRNKTSTQRPKDVISRVVSARMSSEVHTPRELVAGQSSAAEVMVPEHRQSNFASSETDAESIDEDWIRSVLKTPEWTKDADV